MKPGSVPRKPPGVGIKLRFLDREGIFFSTTAFFHPVSDFISYWRTSDHQLDKVIEVEGFQAEQQWKRDFEEDDNSVVGQVREYFRNSKREGRLPANGVHIDIRCLEYTSRPLHSYVSTIPSYIRSQLNCYHRLKSKFFPDTSKQVEILSNVNFTIEEGSMTLVIGSPGSGKVST